MSSILAASAGNAQYGGKVSCETLEGKDAVIHGYGGEGATLVQIDCANGSSGEILGLPMTGFDLLLILIGGLTLIALGLLLRYKNGQDEASQPS